MMKNGIVEEAVIVVGLIGVQFFFAANSVLLGYLMSLGLTPFTIVIFFSLATFTAVAPFAVYFERSKWPKQLTRKLIIQLLLISFLGMVEVNGVCNRFNTRVSAINTTVLDMLNKESGVTLMQFLFIKGIHLASPAIATAMPNIAPGLIFIIAWTCRLEKVDLSCFYHKVKIAGTTICVLGALTMSLMQSTASSKNDATVMPLSPQTDDHQDAIFDQDKIKGCLYLVAAVLCLSINVVLQAATLDDMPAPMSLCAITSFIGMIFAAMLLLVQHHALQWGSPLISVMSLVIFSILGGALSGACVSFNGWAIKKRGPVLVSMFNPIGAVIAVGLSFITLGETISLGCIAGMSLMFSGLYVVLWAKRNETYSVIEEGSESESDPEKSLLI